MSEDMRNLPEEIPDFATVGEAVEYFEAMLSPNLKRLIIRPDLKANSDVQLMLDRRFNDMIHTEDGFYFAYNIFLAVLNNQMHQLGVIFTLVNCGNVVPGVSAQDFEEIRMAIDFYTRYREKLAKIFRSEILASGSVSGANNDFIQ